MPNKVEQFLEQASLEQVDIGLENNSISFGDFLNVVSDNTVSYELFL